MILTGCPATRVEVPEEFSGTRATPQATERAVAESAVATPTEHGPEPGGMLPPVVWTLDQLLGVELTTETATDLDQVPGYGAAIHARIAEQFNVRPADLAVAVTRARDPSRAASVADISIVTVPLPPGNPIGAVGAYVAARVEETTDPVGVDTYWAGGNRRAVAGRDWLTVLTDQALVVIWVDEDSPVAREAADAALALIPAQPEYTFPPYTPLPRDTGPPIPSDAELEAAMPDEVRGQPVRVVSRAYLREIGAGFDTMLQSIVVPHFDAEPADVADAIGGTEIPNFVIWALRLEGVTGQQQLAAFIGEKSAGQISFHSGTVYQSGEVAGRRYIGDERWFYFAEGDIFYWFQYFDFGDCINEDGGYGCDYSDRPPLEELVRDAIAAIPPP